MPLAKTTVFQSDQIEILVGFDGTEPKESVKWFKQFKDKFPCRIAFAINQHYPELPSGFYRNKNLIALMQESFLKLGWYVVVWDNYRETGIVPTELFGSLEVDDDYLLVDDALHIQGRLSVWESLGGKSHFYHDQFIFEIITDETHGRELVKFVEAECRAKSVACEIVI
jgi:hypothetical protein